MNNKNIQWIQRNEHLETQLAYKQDEEFPLFKIKDPFIQVLNQDGDYYQIKISFPMIDKKGKEVAFRGGIIKFRPESFFVTPPSSQYVITELHRPNDGNDYEI
jgi:hypothetical protein